MVRGAWGGERDEVEKIQTKGQGGGTDAGNIARTYRLTSIWGGSAAAEAILAVVSASS